MADEVQNVERLCSGLQHAMQQLRRGIEQELDFSQVGVEQATESAADHIGFLLNRKFGKSQRLSHDHEDAHGAAPGRNTFGGNGREDVAREVHFFEREERPAIVIVDEFPGLVGNPVDIGGKDQVEPLTRLFRARRIVESPHLAGKQRLEQRPPNC